MLSAKWLTVRLGHLLSAPWMVVTWGRFLSVLRLMVRSGRWWLSLGGWSWHVCYLYTVDGEVKTMLSEVRLMVVLDRCHLQ
jgi:hypothetical protein